MLVAWRACSRHLSRLSACHYTDAATLRIPLLTRSRAYYDLPSFSARPNTLTARIWLRKDGTPRSKWKGVFYVFYALAVALAELENQKNAIGILFRLQFVDVDFPSADLSTLQGAHSYLCSIYCAVVAKEKSPLVHLIFARCVEYMVSEQCNTEVRERLHRMACKTSEGIHLGLQKAKAKDEPIEDIALAVVQLLAEQLGVLDEIVFSKSDQAGTVEIMKILASKDPKGKSDDYDVVG
ncbi:hypothetical protein AX15_007529 [Amanita polypyramis BW_CC]|nr:hypothetical protein AX15_007529 [Amanita polypyramis BW_CC]